MRLVLSSALLGVAWFTAANLAASAAAWIAARTIEIRGRHSAALLVAVRLFPAAFSCLFVLGVFLPAHWVFEPGERDERFGAVLGAIAVAGASMLVRSGWRALRVVSTDLRLALLTRRAARPLDAGAYEIGGLHGVSLAGVLRPKILVGSAAVAALTPAELDAAIAHEIAHQRSRDNVKRFLMHCAPDVFGWSAAARRLELLWQAESECQADAHAVRGDERRAIVLASALVKVARLTRRAPERRTIVPSPAWSAFHVPTLLETRVARLVSGRPEAVGGFRRLWCGMAAVAAAVPAAAWMFDLSYSLHQVTEALVTALP